MRAQISLWMLTKFGMIFFIVALSAIILSFETSTKNNVCKDQANSIAYSIASRITQVLESPAEDEQRTYAFPGGLSLGRSDRVRYNVQITDRKDSPGATAGRLIVNVSPSSSLACQGASSVPYKDFIIHQNAAGGRSVGVDKVLTFSPSNLDFNLKSFYLVILKCGNKLHPPGTGGYERHLFINDCVNPDIDGCNVVKDGEAGNGPMAVEDICGFPAETP
jgi:hypothetical protein